MTINKVLKSFEEAVSDISDGAVVALSCFGGPLHAPQNLIRAVAKKGPKNLTVIAHAVGIAEGQTVFGWPLHIDYGIWIEKGMVRKLIAGFPFIPTVETPPKTEWKAGRLEVVNLPHGTLQVKLWAAGAGVGGVYVRTGVGTVIEEGKEKRLFHGEEYLMEEPFKIDFSLVRAYKADRLGNLIYDGDQRATAPMVARAGKITIAEVDEIVEVGELNPEHIITPGIYVHRILAVPKEV